ncbi:hypothetical protein C8J56DRAFT_892721 [Mycena floridula]|nr:hypothetical protein C8J56DRAFT_892721 [Mycena floridula]
MPEIRVWLNQQQMNPKLISCNSDGSLCQPKYTMITRLIRSDKSTGLKDIAVKHCKDAGGTYNRVASLLTRYKKHELLRSDEGEEERESQETEKEEQRDKRDGEPQICGIERQNDAGGSGEQSESTYTVQILHIKLKLNVDPNKQFSRPEYPPPQKLAGGSTVAHDSEYWDNVTKIQRDGREGEYGVGGDGRREIQETRDEGDECGSAHKLTCSTIKLDGNINIAVKGGAKGQQGSCHRRRKIERMLQNRRRCYSGTMLRKLRRPTFWRD